MTFGKAVAGRRGMIVGAALAGLGALVAIDLAGSSGSPQLGGELSGESKLRHLLRRAGFGASPAEFATYQKLGLNGTIDRLVNYDTIDNRALEDRLTRAGLDLTKRPDLARWWALRMIYTSRPLEEKMTLFWHGLLTSAISKVGRPEPMLTQNAFFRQNALGRFPDLLKGVSKDPAMMIWLDTATNRKGHPNENYARELMELFSLGVGNYSEADVREGARAFTGWSLLAHPKLGEFQYRFVPNQHDTGSKTFLGQTGNFDGNDIVDILVRQPASAHFITNKLFAFFAYPNPTADVLDPLVNVYTSSDYSIKALVQAIFSSPAFYSPTAYRALVKSPVEYAVGAARTLGVETDAKGLAYALAQMGQEIFNPPNVAGWHGGKSWLTSGTWLARLNLANGLVGGLDGPAHPTALASAPTASALNQLLDGTASPAGIVNRLVDTLLDGQISPEQRQVLVDYLTPPGNVSFDSADKAWLDERQRGALYLVLAMPEYHLA